MGEVKALLRREKGWDEGNLLVAQSPSPQPQPSPDGEGDTGDIIQ